MIDLHASLYDKFTVRITEVEILVADSSKLYTMYYSALLHNAFHVSNWYETTQTEAQLKFSVKGKPWIILRLLTKQSNVS